MRRAAGLAGRLAAAACRLVTTSAGASSAQAAAATGRSFSAAAAATAACLTAVASAQWSLLEAAQHMPRQHEGQGDKTQDDTPCPDCDVALEDQPSAIANNATAQVGAPLACLLPPSSHPSPGRSTQPCPCCLPAHVLQWRVFTDMGRELVQQGRHGEAERYFLKAPTGLTCLLCCCLPLCLPAAHRANPGRILTRLRC